MYAITVAKNKSPQISQRTFDLAGRDESEGVMEIT
jgi:hypothetical protein